MRGVAELHLYRWVLRQVTEKRLRKAHIIDDVVDGVSLDKSLTRSFVVDYGSSSVDCGDLFPQSQARLRFFADFGLNGCFLTFCF